VLLDQESVWFLINRKLAAISDLILALSDLLGEVVERALDVVDNTPIKLFQSPTGREVFEVNSNYLLFPNLPFCTCRSYHNQVLTRDEYCCKHYIATRIARALNKVEIVEKDIYEFRKLLKRIKF
jgi:predicted nucleic acid-binding Zn finger protein